MTCAKLSGAPAARQAWPRRLPRACRDLRRGSEICRRIGENGLGLIRKIKPKGDRINALTHCNAGWLATVDWGTALAPIYQAHNAGIPVHVWVDETRPRNQGASLTAWELAKHGVPHTVIADNAGGHLMQRGQVDFCITGTDRTTRRGDVCNKIGTYLKALAAHDNGIPFYVGCFVPDRLDHRTYATSRSMSATPARSRASLPHPNGRGRHGDVLPEGSPPPLPPSTPAGRLVTALITGAGSRPRSGPPVALSLTVPAA